VRKDPREQVSCCRRPVEVLHVHALFASSAHSDHSQTARTSAIAVGFCPPLSLTKESRVDVLTEKRKKKVSQVFCMTEVSLGWLRLGTALVLAVLGLATASITLRRTIDIFPPDPRRSTSGLRSRTTASVSTAPRSLSSSCSHARRPRHIKIAQDPFSIRLNSRPPTDPFGVRPNTPGTRAHLWHTSLRARMRHGHPLLPGTQTGQRRIDLSTTQPTSGTSFFTHLASGGAGVLSTRYLKDGRYATALWGSWVRA
jgi:hypothetical protein